jgi:small subunit ribosomal protein S1
LDIEKKYAIGQLVQGVIEKKEPFGYFISLEPGVTGLLPKSKMEGADSASQIEKLKVNDAIAVLVESVNTRDRKISLTVSDAATKDEWKNFMPGNRSAAPSSLGALGEKLQAALKLKK